MRGTGMPLVCKVCDRGADTFQQLQFMTYHSVRRQACIMYYCIAHNINDTQHYQLCVFLLKCVCENNPHIMLAVDNVSMLYISILWMPLSWLHNIYTSYWFSFRYLKPGDVKLLVGTTIVLNYTHWILPLVSHFCTVFMRVNLLLLSEIQIVCKTYDTLISRHCTSIAVKNPLASCKKIDCVCNISFYRVYTAYI